MLLVRDFSGVRDPRNKREGTIFSNSVSQVPSGTVSSLVSEPCNLESSLWTCKKHPRHAAPCFANSAAAACSFKRGYFLLKIVWILYSSATRPELRLKTLWSYRHCRCKTKPAGPQAVPALGVMEAGKHACNVSLGPSLGLRPPCGAPSRGENCLQNLS